MTSKSCEHQAASTARVLGHKRNKPQICQCVSRAEVTEIPREVKTKKSRDCRTRVRNHIFPAYILVVLL
ncbi:hypothetical protein ACOSP7_019408 [Xanthoceras sorbifolium]